MLVRDLVTTILELAGLLLLVAAAAVYTSRWSAAGALAVAGAGLIGVSYLLTRKGRRRVR